MSRYRRPRARLTGPPTVWKVRPRAAQRRLSPYHEAEHAEQLRQLDLEYAGVSSQLSGSNSDQQRELIMEKKREKAPDKMPGKWPMKR